MRTPAHTPELDDDPVHARQQAARLQAEGVLLPALVIGLGHLGLRTLKEFRREVYERVSMVGLAVVLLLFFIGLSNDIGKLS